MIIKGFKPFAGQHCETTATGSLLNQLGIELSEPMLFGLGEGLSFIFWNMKLMDFPFIGGRIKPGAITQNLAKNLKLELEVKETSSVKKAWKNVADHLDNGIAVGLQLDCYHLDYFATKIHFAGHFVAIYGYDDEYAYLVDTKPQGGKVKTSLKSLELARSEKGPMSAKNLMYSLHNTNKHYNISEAIINAISSNAKEYLNPPIKNIAYKGILKTSAEVKKWFKNSKDIEGEFGTTAILMEKAGTGGALFRNIYRDFLKESYELTGLKPLHTAHVAFIEISKRWTEVAALFDTASKTQEIEYISKASDILVDLSKREFSAIKLLETLN